ncbi:MAG: ferredoxin [Candidatus Omnitrophica bacterium]|nr:ferredoxin [Candidatus Omnitrophota bacterium]
MKASVDKEKCIGCSLCVQMAPGIFKTERGVAVCSLNNIPREKETEAKDVAGKCPVDAIIIIE